MHRDKNLSLSESLVAPGQETFLMPGQARGTLTVRNKQLVWGLKTYIMGIINVTPDSFSGDGIIDHKAAIERALEHISNGAEIIDVGGESTRPGYQPVAEEEEIQRIAPVIAGLRGASDALISVDTCKVSVFEQAVKHGADILNSIWGIQGKLLEAALAANVPLVVMHNKSEPIYQDIVEEVLSYLAAQAEALLKAGFSKERIILDLGIGFGKLAEHNLALLGALSRFVALGFPTMVGASRKSFIGKITGRAVQDRSFGTAACVALSANAGIDIVRVHDVASMSDVVKVADAIARGWQEDNWQGS